MYRMTGDIFSGPYGKRKVFQICKHLHRNACMHAVQMW